MAKTSGLVPQFMDEPMEASTPLVPITIPTLLNEAVPEKKVVGHPSRDFQTPLSNQNG